MNDLNREFDSAMAAGVNAHIHGNYELALEERFRALSLADNRLERGMAARDISAAYDRLSDQKTTGATIEHQVLADEYAEYAYREHKVAMEKEYPPKGNNSFTELAEEATREFSASAMYLAISKARNGNVQEAYGIMDEGWRASRILYIRHRSEGTENPSYHQYDVNIISRYAALKAIAKNMPDHEGTQPRTAKDKLEIERDRRETRRLGRLALIIAPTSENPKKVLGVSHGLSHKDRRAAQRKASVRALAANAIVLLESFPTTNRPKSLTDTLLHKIVL